MIKFENTEVMGWKAAIRGMRNPMNSWEKGDSLFIRDIFCDDSDDMKLADLCGGIAPIVGDNDLDLMKRLQSAGTDHRKFLRMIIVYVDITAPLYWWKEFDTYKVGTVANSCSTMHKIADKEFVLEDFSLEHLMGSGVGTLSPMKMLESTINLLNNARQLYLETSEKIKKVQESYQNGALDTEEMVLTTRELQEQKEQYWWQMIQLLPSSYNQKRTIMFNYEVLANIYKSRKNHKLDEWREHDESAGKGFCDWIKELPYSELIIGEKA